ncbi:unnamed protein product [Leptosia nina]|uniref:Secreted protein n=1 Tax=Leptosia nina TaxID=320188 RepID=A0AAV1J3H1_9NEOP
MIADKSPVTIVCVFLNLISLTERATVISVAMEHFWPRFSSGDIGAISLHILVRVQLCLTTVTSPPRSLIGEGKWIGAYRKFAGNVTYNSD